MIHKEAWYIESRDRELSKLVQAYLRSFSPEDAQKMWSAHLRDNRYPEIGYWDLPKEGNPTITLVESFTPPGGGQVRLQKELSLDDFLDLKKGPYYWDDVDSPLYVSDDAMGWEDYEDDPNFSELNQEDWDKAEAAELEIRTALSPQQRQKLFEWWEDAPWRLM